tara:strand:- start:189 stop:413 length:225 start_codon:yes stop_codon:yes gene_type:complete
MIKSYILIMTMMISFLWFGSQAMANPVTTWITTEKDKIVEYQTKSWSDSKVQWASTKESIVNLFTKVKTSVTQD